MKRDERTSDALDTKLRRRAHGRIQRSMRAHLRAHGSTNQRARAPQALIGGAPPSSGDLAGTMAETHVFPMQMMTKTELVGFMELQVGSLAVQVPIRSAEPAPSLPLASFEVEGEACAILIRGDSSSKAVERAMGEAAKQAMAHLSRKLLN